MMTFEESLHYLLSLGNEVSTMKLGLENIRKLLVALDNPHQNYLKVQVAGTNGKGSVCAFLDSICFSAEIRTGLYTSPHLISITERIKIGGREISKQDFALHATKIRETSERLVKSGELKSVPTFFEQVTAIALNVFAEEKVELAILETGLGGRLDATTAANAEIVAITQIAFDHQEYLGETLEEIAAEKAAIIRADTKVILAPQRKEVERVILGKCREVGVEPIWATTDFTVRKDPASDHPFLFTKFKTNKDNYSVMLLFLLGRHQFANAAVAIAIAESLSEFGLEIPPESIEGGLGSAENKGRLELWGNPGDFLFDGAHNVAGAQTLAEFLDEFITQPITMIFGSVKDKDVSGIAQILFPKAKQLILTESLNPRAMPVAEISKFVPATVKKENLFVTETMEKALKLAEEISPPENLICITGSLYLVGEAQKILSSEFKL